jgi:hypothetical protein
MTIEENNQRLFLDDLAKRWGMGGDRVMELAITGKVTLWIAFADVFVQKAALTGASKKRKASVPQFHSEVEVRPLPELLTQLQSRCDRMLIAAELSCLDDQGKAVTITNSVGEEWGETSMIGLNPARLFARLDDVVRFEQGNTTAAKAEVTDDDQKRQEPARNRNSSLNPQGHPCFARELHIAVECWQTLCAPVQTAATVPGKATLLAWIGANYPDLSGAAANRIAQIVSPLKKGGA